MIWLIYSSVAKGVAIEEVGSEPAKHMAWDETVRYEKGEKGRKIWTGALHGKQNTFKTRGDIKSTFN